MSNQGKQPKKKILDEARDRLRVQHYSIRTERSYLDWMRRFILHHGFKNRDEKLVSKHGTFKGNAILANQIARAVYFMLQSGQAFDAERMVAHRS